MMARSEKLPITSGQIQEAKGAGERADGNSYVGS